MVKLQNIPKIVTIIKMHYIRRNASNKCQIFNARNVLSDADTYLRCPLLTEKFKFS